MSKSFFPPVRTLMGPGPSDVSPRVLAALSRPTIGHLDPLFIDLMDDIKRLLQYAFQTANALTLPVSAPGSAGMEAVFVNLLEPGDKVIVCQNGVFGGRMRENVERCGADAIMVEDSWGTPIDSAKVEQALEQHPDAVALAFVHSETSTGVRSDAKALCELAKRHNCLSIVDAVTSLAGIELKVDDWGIDAIYSGTQKCLSCVPGLSPVSFSERAVKRIKSRTTKVQSWFLDMNLVMDYWGAQTRRSYHHTAPVNALYALHESLLMLEEEGLTASHNRHASHHQALAAGFEAMGLGLPVASAFRLPQLNAVSVPAGIDEAKIRQLLLQDWNLEIGAGLGSLAGKVWRVGLMGHTATRQNVIFCLSAMEQTLQSQGAGIHVARALPAAQQVYNKIAPGVA
ncbi:MAG: alanine--glyoxylate aminotransferase family protein [Pseudohongiella sp.]|nr:alanine--glyoxylate aminotransferase family protein [Pseudohongiella sp.]